jgi:glycosyltransferase involved in cell wall biosynthesis
VFVGALDIATNVTALAWLLDSVWPAVRSGQPQARLVVVGRHPDSALQARLARTEGVRLEADVPEVGPYLHRSAVAVNPAVSGSGVNIKLVEYLQAGCAVVSTSLATRGLPLEPDVDLLVRDEPDGFAHAVSALLADPVAARRLGTTGREHLLALLDPDRLLRQVAALMVGRPG